MGKLSEEAKELLRQPIHAWVTTVRPNGSLHSTVVWVDVDGDDVVFNTAVGRAKERHLREDPRVSVSVLDPKDAFHLVSVSGKARLELDGADEVIDRLAGKYLGVETYPYRQPGEQRITVRVTPDEVIFSPGS
ncbi:PPOX class probable F420-dependent enzyme [Streptosporangium becharense]|uniref:PPOX class probable F420-dependent enzyme n=1 Tax=Streptosporangium becharense TaxID=1816182 RepID=A0A7W9IMK9_9ACTN|nr:TIGR03618 family F420-dependent PPOX class oxidoreductase [Streptosporangium becharense]MBB2914461.1 PPOX class probable F420-dependent enzyme [Streptosporangium becharense]MBB5823507.1 PPOX class probable F420-dependent enzyme [Streptosporangium becharense]